MEDNNNILSGQKLKLFDNVIRELNTSIKNSALYTPDHSICIFSIENLKTTLDAWFEIENVLDVGVAQNEIYCNGLGVEEPNMRYEEVAAYLHLRGIVRLSFSRGVEKGELVELFRVISRDSRKIRAEGGIFKQIEELANIAIQEVDYSSLLSSADDDVVSEEGEVWKHIFSIAEDMKKGTDIPGSKMEFLKGFLKDTKGSAKALNGMYKDAVTKLETDEKADEIRETVSKICTYFGEKSPEEAKEVKVELMEIISQLHPDLITKLFEKTQVEETEFDLAEAVTKDFSDNFIANFIESLIGNEDTFNENLLKVFDKLAPDANKANSVVSMVADKLFSKRILNPATLSKLQTSIKDIFSDHPESNFMSQMHKITVDAVTNKKIDTLVYVARLSPLISKFVRSVEENHLKKEEVWLLLNLLWLENDATDFKKFGIKLSEVMPELMDMKDTSRVRDIVDFFTDKLRPEQKKDDSIVSSASAVMTEIITKENLDNIISFIPEAQTQDLENIIDILTKSQKSSVGNVVAPLVDAFIEEKNPAYKNKYRVVLSKLKKEVTEEVLDRLEYSEPYAIRDLFRILKETDREKAHLVAKKLIVHSNPQVRWEGLNDFELRNEEEKEVIINIFEKEKVDEVRRKAATVLLSIDDPALVDRLFVATKKKMFNAPQLFMLVELCGHLKLMHSFDYLKAVFNKKGFFGTKKRDELRNAALTSLGRLHTDEAMGLVKKAVGDKRESVRNFAEILVKLDAGRDKGKQKEDGEHAGN